MLAVRLGVPLLIVDGGANSNSLQRDPGQVMASVAKLAFKDFNNLSDRLVGRQGGTPRHDDQGLFPHPARGHIDLGRKTSQKI